MVEYVAAGGAPGCSAMPAAIQRAKTCGAMGLAGGGARALTRVACRHGVLDESTRLCCRFGEWGASHSPHLSVGKDG